MLHGLCRSLVISGAALLLCTAGPAAAGSDCVTFSGLEHCALGDAGLALSEEVLQVSGVGPDGGDGVAVTLSNARVWGAGVQLSDGDSNPGVILGASAGGEEISRAELVAADDGVHLSATFTGADGPGTYSILVYRGGTLVGSQGGVGERYWLNIDEWADLLNLIYWHFYNRMADGACVWTVGFTQPLRLALPDGTELEGDEIHLVEEVGDGGHYPYVEFDGITVRSSRDLQIVNEVAQ